MTAFHKPSRFQKESTAQSRVPIVDNTNSGSEFSFKGKFQHGDLFSNVKLAFDIKFETTDELNLASGIEAEELYDFAAINTASIAFGYNKYDAPSIGFDGAASGGFSELDLSDMPILTQSGADDIGGQLQSGNGALTAIPAQLAQDPGRVFVLLAGARKLLSARHNRAINHLKTPEGVVRSLHDPFLSAALNRQPESTLHETS